MKGTTVEECRFFRREFINQYIYRCWKYNLRFRLSDCKAYVRQLESAD